MRRILAVGLSSTLQKTIVFPGLALDQVNRATEYLLDASGKAVNAARVLNQLEPGCVTSLSPLGEENAQLFLDLAVKDELDVAWVPVPGKTRYCYTCVDPQIGTTTELVVDEPVSAGAEAVAGFARATDEILETLTRRLETAEAMLLAGSRPKAWPEEMSARICKLAKDAGKIVMADFHGKDLALTLERCIPDVIKINEQEFCGTFGYNYPLSTDELRARISEKSAEFANAIVITRGSKDTYAGYLGIAFSHPVNAVMAVNATGCGDSFTAGFLYSWLESRDMEAALAKGSWCATRNALNLRCGSIRDGNE